MWGLVSTVPCKSNTYYAYSMLADCYLLIYSLLHLVPSHPGHRGDFGHPIVVESFLYSRKRYTHITRSIFHLDNGRYTLKCKVILSHKNWTNAMGKNYMDNRRRGPRDDMFTARRQTGLDRLWRRKRKDVDGGSPSERRVKCQPAC